MIGTVIDEIVTVIEVTLTKIGTVMVVVLNEITTSTFRYDIQYERYNKVHK